jgi:hypothetical protein
VLQKKGIGKDTKARKYYEGCFKLPDMPLDGLVELAMNGNFEEALTLVGPGEGLRMLPPGHIHERAKRYAVKLFLSALHEVWYYYRYGTRPPKPYPITHLGHAHYMPPPNFPG